VTTLMNQVFRWQSY